MTSSFIKGLHNVKPGYPEIFFVFCHFRILRQKWLDKTATTLSHLALQNLIFWVTCDNC